MLLEDGRGINGRARLAWGARARYRLDWTAAAVGDLPWLKTLPGDRRLYGMLAYDLGLPHHAQRAEPVVPQLLADFIEPEREVVLDCDSGALLRGSWQDLGEPVGGRGGPARPPVRPSARLCHRSFTQAEFESAVRRVQDYIAAGDVYQVNIAVGDRYETDLSPWELYRRLRALNPSPWMGFADFGDWQLVSGSPELLVEVGGHGRSKAVEGGLGGPGGQDPVIRSSGHPVVVRTRPIAGTRKKTGDPVQDAAMRAELALDAKEQAEHRMLVDLARNDVGRVAEFGSVRVAEREVVEEYSHVFHLVSDVTGVLRVGAGVTDVLAALFPGGTITGAPKIRAMEVIAELEPVARGAYTGGLGWIGPDGAQVNILIRSAVCRDGAVGIHAGAGIVWDSDPAREWRESLRKAAALRVALGAEP
ncbi:MAG: anthranilate synthase component I family protein [Gemmatimonadota bacterium]|nr:anthranilate synthase component I family protein [Gemmatimonadota bacterium]MDH5196341.1 anthranilate synthase component I family protein [Gemmatimonadota bacterium]